MDPVSTKYCDTSQRRRTRMRKRMHGRTLPFITGSRPGTASRTARVAFNAVGTRTRTLSAGGLQPVEAPIYTYGRRRTVERAGSQRSAAWHIVDSSLS